MGLVVRSAVCDDGIHNQLRVSSPVARLLITVPPRLDEVLRGGIDEPGWLGRIRCSGDGAAFIGSDPPDRRLGSGGGTVNLLFDAWQAECASGSAIPLEEWLATSQKVIIHSGGETRRLPAYAALGKAFMPLPPVAGLSPRLHDQVLADFQIPTYLEVLAEAGPRAAALVTSGDVWLDFDTTEIPTVSADVTGIGMRVPNDIAQHFGVFFVERTRLVRNQARPVAFFLQKPTPQAIAASRLEFEAFVDTGMWLLGVAALRFLFEACGWDSEGQRFATPDGRPGYLDLYTDVGPALGFQPAAPPGEDSPVWTERAADLTTSVVALDDARFYHLGSSRQLLDSMERVQWRSYAPRRAYQIASPGHGFSVPVGDPTWIEGSAAGHQVRLDGFNFLTGLPAEASLDHLAPGACVNVLPVGADRYAVLPYHIDDAFRGGSDSASICGQPARAWLERRGLTATADGPASTATELFADVFEAPLYPVVAASDITQELVDWFFSDSPAPATTARVAALPLLSAARLPEHLDFGRYFEQRRTLLERQLCDQLEAALDQGDSAPFEQDCAALASFCDTDAPGLRKWITDHGRSLLDAPNRPEHQARAAMLLASLASGEERAGWRSEGFGRLRTALISGAHFPKANPISVLKADQIVWARSPVRLDLAGGWTDTPPFCLEAGGSVLNVAVLLNGQPPIQVFARRIAEPILRLRSIDLGSSEEVRAYEELQAFLAPGQSFSLPKAALTLSGFHPDFTSGPGFPSLEAQLAGMGGGLEISMLSAVPKGSGLGTSSILASTLLGAISRACGLEWDDLFLYDRVLGVEQLLTSGGGWQDQAGALFPGLKLIETRPGLSQSPTVRYLPHRLLDDHVNRSLLLYYTGVTRVAKGILQEIVEDMFVGRAQTIRTLEGLRTNARRLYAEVQLHDLPGMTRCVARSWRLNKQLDGGVSTPEIDAMLAACGRDLVAAKFLGAGGGGFMVMCACDAAAGLRIRERLESEPPNDRARFVDFSVAPAGLEVTVS